MGKGGLISETAFPIKNGLGESRREEAHLKECAINGYRAHRHSPYVHETQNQGEGIRREARFPRHQEGSCGDMHHRG